MKCCVIERDTQHKYTHTHTHTHTYIYIYIKMYILTAYLVIIHFANLSDYFPTQLMKLPRHTYIFCPHILPFDLTVYLSIRLSNKRTVFRDISMQLRGERV